MGSLSGILTCDKPIDRQMGLTFMRCIDPHVSAMPDLYQLSVACGCGFGCGSSRVFGCSGRPCSQVAALCDRLTFGGGSRTQCSAVGPDS